MFFFLFLKIFTLKQLVEFNKMYIAYSECNTNQETISEQFQDVKHNAAKTEKVKKKTSRNKIK